MGGPKHYPGARIRNTRPEKFSYGPDPEQEGDLWLAHGREPAPVVVLVHGGFWRAAHGRDLMDGLAADLQARGRMVWNVEYRRVGQPGGGWPGTLDDVAAAVDFLADLAAAGVPMDLARVAAVGHSAGGQLALWLAARHEARVPLAAAVSLAGVADLVAAAETGVGGTAVPDLLGGTPGEVPDRYAAASPVALVPSGVRARCVHCWDDDVVPIEQSERYVAAARAAGDHADLVAVPGGHLDVLDPAHPSWRAVVEVLGELRPRS